MSANCNGRGPGESSGGTRAGWVGVEVDSRGRCHKTLRRVRELRGAREARGLHLVDGGGVAGLISDDLVVVVDEVDVIL